MTSWKLALTKWIPDKPYLQLMFFKHFGRFIDFKNPRTFNEKLQWLKLYDRNPEYTRMVDKYEAKKYVAEKIGEEYIIPTLGVWDTPEEIDFDSLPDQFVLKWNHDSGSVVICRDKKNFDKAAALQKLQRGKRYSGFWYGREWPYKNVRPCIIAEKYMVDESGTELKDYKVMCFHGEPKLIQIHRGRFGTHAQDFYDVLWNLLDVEQGYPQSADRLEKPDCLEQMLMLSSMLSRESPQLRVDWYFVEGKLYFGEMTLFDGSGFCGFDPEEYDAVIGSWIELPRRGLAENTTPGR